MISAKWPAYSTTLMAGIASAKPINPKENSSLVIWYTCQPTTTICICMAMMMHVQVVKKNESRAIAALRMHSCFWQRFSMASRPSFCALPWTANFYGLHIGFSDFIFVDEPKCSRLSGMFALRIVLPKAHQCSRAGTNRMSESCLSRISCGQLPYLCSLQILIVIKLVSQSKTWLLS